MRPLTNDLPKPLLPAGGQPLIDYHVQALARGSYADIAATLLAERRAAAMPPYAHLALLRAEGKRCAQALDFLEQVRVKAGALQKGQAMAVEQLGPLPAPMEKRAGRYRGQLLFKSESRPALQNFLGRLLPEVEAMQTRGGLRWSLDVDPQDLI